MYLNKLNNEQKELFLDLSIHAAMANDDFADEEKETIKQYCSEMNIAERFDAKFSNDEVVEKLTAISSKQEMRIVFMEIMALVLSDNIFDDQEQAFVKKVAAAAQVTDEEKDRIVDTVQELYVVYGNIARFINS